MARFLSKYSVPIIIVLCMALALLLRVVIPFHLVFTSTGVRFNDVDAYAHMRQVDNTLAHFPQRTPFNPYTYFPEGAPVYYPPLFTMFLSGFIWIFSFGAHNPQSIDIVGALFPAILGTLTVIPVFFLGKTLFNRWAGVIAALLVAILPGEILGRTMLGSTGHHVIEILFPTTSILFFVLAMKAAQQIQWKSWREIFHTRKNLKIVWLSILAGIFLGLYLQMWAGGPVFVLIFFCYFIAQFLIDYWKKKPSAYLCITGTITMLIASLIILPFLPKYYSPSLYFISLAAATLTPILLQSFSNLLAKKRVKTLFYAGCLLGIGLLAFGLFYLVSPSLLKSLMANFNILNPSGTDLTIAEANPLLFPNGSFTLSVAWANFTMGFYLAIIAFIILTYQMFKRGESDKTMLVFWTLSTFIMTLAQRRFAYYYAINVALLSGYLGWLILKWGGLGKETLGNTVSNIKQKIVGKVKSRPTAWQGLMRIASVGALAIIIIPNIAPAINTVDQTPFAPDNAWIESLTWLRENSPPPFGNQDLYYSVVNKTNPGPLYDYPDTAYGVMAWWDYGNWITRIAHRLPNHAPGGGRSPIVAQCFVAPDETSAIKLTQELGSRYLIIDFPTLTTKFDDVTTFAGTSRINYFDTYYTENNGSLEAVTLFYPEYYQTLAVRLYCFNGAAVTPNSTSVIKYDVQTDPEGTKYKVINNLYKFNTYDEAQAFVTAQKTGNFRIVSSDPFVSPVPLPALQDYSLVYQSPDSDGATYPKGPTPVKIFIFLGKLQPSQYTQSEGKLDISLTSP